MGNYLDARQPQKNNALMGEVLPTSGIAPGGFGQWSGQTQKGPAVDPVREAQGLAIKYSALFVVSIFLAWGITAKGGQSIVWGLSFFGVVVFAGYFALSLMENIFERESGHVVWAFFGTIVELFRLWFSYKLMVIEKSNENLRLRRDAYEQQALAAQRNAIVDKQATPQSSRNQLANYVEPEVDDRDWSHLETIPATVLQPAKPAAVPVATDNGTDALLALCDFVEYLLVNPDKTNIKGVLLNVQAPWGQRSKVPGPVKEQIETMLGEFTPPIFVWNETSQRYQFMRDNYPDMHAVYAMTDKIMVSRQ